MSKKPPNIADDLREADEAIANLVNLYFDRVPTEGVDREQLTECIYEGLSDEFDRVYRIEAALTTLAERWEQMTKAAPHLGDELLIDEPTPVQLQQIVRANTYRKAASDIRDVLRTGHVPHDLMTTAELEQYGTPEATS